MGNKEQSSLREKCSVRMQENTDQKISEYGHFHAVAVTDSGCSCSRVRKSVFIKPQPVKN